MEKIMQLNSNWTLSYKDGKVNASVPGDVSLDLYRAGKIADPYFGLNHKDQTWIHWNDYVYENKFDVSADILDKEEVLLEFDSIDTFAEITLNGKYLGNTENMFLKYTYSVKELLKDKNNVLTVKLISTRQKMDEIDTADYFGCFNVQRIFVRKAQCHFGWDWAPDLPGFGICGDVRIKGVSKSRIDNVYCRTHNDGNVTFIVQLNYTVRDKMDLEDNIVKASDPACKNDILRYSIAKNPNEPLTDDNTITYEHKVIGEKNFANLKVENVQLWWPVGYGEHPLYSYKIEIIRNGQVINAYENRIGFREIKLEQKPIDNRYVTYKFIINGVETFIKGSNWVPPECFSGDMKDEKYEMLIDRAVAGNLNMLRIWGGGAYEKDIFYNLCDEKGIMVWQDCMFACADIPDSDQDFMERVRKEITYQIKRLRNHPSIIYWCGGNEKTGSYGLQISHGDYLVEIVLRGLILNLDDTRPFAKQSPVSFGDVGNEPYSGETHSSALEHCLKNGIDTYRDFISSRFIPFISECALMGPSSVESIKKMFPEDKLWPMNEYWEDRLMENPYSGLDISFAKRQQMYADWLYGESANVEQFVAKGMTVHAEAMRLELEHARSNKGKTWGFLNWMFNDIWPSGTWSIVDYYGEPKQVYYQIKKSYAPILLTFVQNNNYKVALTIVNDTVNAIDTQVEYGLKTLDGKVIWNKKANMSVAMNAASQLELTDEVKTENCYLYAKCEVNGKELSTVYSHDLWHTCKFESDYTYTAKEVENGILVTVKANKFAKGVIVRLPDNFKYTYEDNYFDLQAGEEKTILITGTKGANINDLVVTDFAKEIKHA